MRRRIWAGCLTAAALTALVALPAVASAATIAVNTTADALVPTDGRCSLREAITAANLDIASGPAAGECRAGAGPDAIQLPAGSFDATGTGDDANAGGDFDITSAIDLVGVGNGPSGTNVRGTTDRVFDMRPGAVVTMANLWILDGHAPDGTTGGSGTTGGAGGAGSDGGGIRSAGTLTLTGVKVSNSRPGDGGAGGTATGTDGGAGANGGPALGGAGGNGGNGGGIHTTGPLTIRNSTISDNLGGAGIGGGDGLGGRGGDGVGGGGNGGNGGAGRGGDGGDAGIGGISVAGGGSLNLSGSVVTNNTAGTGGVGGSGRNGLGGAGTVNGNGGAGATNRGGDGGDGAPGGIGGTGAITVATSTVSANRASDGGPGTSGTGGAGGPGAGTGDGGDGGAALGGQGGAGGSGGAIGGSLASITASLVTGNSAGKGGNGGGASGAGGGAGSPAGVPGVGAGGAGGNGGRGGGLFASGSPNAVNVTLPDNAAGAGGAGGAAIAFGAAALGGAGGTGGSGGDAALAGGTLTHLTVTGGSVGGGGGGGTANGDVGSSPGLGGAGGAGPGILRSGGTLTVANSIFSGTSCSGTITDGGHNIDFPDSTCPGAAVRPELGPLAANGGPTQTFRLMAGSAALDSVPALGASCPLTDQRGAVRPFGAGCDAGAFEVAPPAASTGAAQGVSTTTATATGTVTPRGLATSSRVDFGETTAYGQAADAGSTASPVPVGVTAALAGLKPATTYHYRLVAQSPDGQAIGGDATFVTAAATAAGTPRPTLSALGVSPNRFAVAKGATALSARAVPRGTTISYRLSAKAAVRLSMQQAGKGVKVRRRGNTTCVPAGARRFKRAAKRLRCTAFTVRGTLTRAGAAGANRVRFSGRIGKRALKLGGYRVVASATNAGGRSNDATKAFRIVPFRR